MVVILTTQAAKKATGVRRIRSRAAENASRSSCVGGIAKQTRLVLIQILAKQAASRVSNVAGIGKQTGASVCGSASEKTCFWLILIVLA